jgi:hypothetical protein
MPIEEIRRKAIMGEAISPGEMVLAICATFDQAKKTNGTVLDHEKEIKGLKTNYAELHQALGALTDEKIQEAAKHRGLMVIPKFMMKGALVLGALGGAVPLVGFILTAWHLVAADASRDSELKGVKEVVQSTAVAVQDHTAALQENQQISLTNQKAILDLIQRDADKQTARDNKRDQK